ncbi:MAG: aryl-sulfate sulfotransferase [Crocinitomicaceae bacterium]|nr:aryl-sulfate sulfotransferase [Crocinitomicaceae bacterium]
MKITAVILLTLLLNISFSQSPSIGLIYDSGLAADGYTLFAPESNQEVYLMDNCGEIVNQWTCNEVPGKTSYFLENGNLLHAGQHSLEIRDWDDNLLWEYQTTSNGISQHHDIEPLPNGNILLIVSDFKSSAELIAAGRDPNAIGNNFKMDKILELEPVGTNGANIVWEWYFWDHLIQELDSTKANFGVVADHPELLDLNFQTSSNSDWTHLNGIDYNTDLDQIIMSSRTISEIYIIDHSTSLAESSTDSGGNAQKGGDFLWRWGNPIVYHQGTSFDQQLFGQHDSKWVENGYLHDGKISVFNNALNGSSTISAVHLIEPIMSGTYNYQINANLFEPLDFFSTWSGDVLGIPMYTPKKGGANSLPNGGFMICESTKGRFIEIDEAGNVVWVYKNPSGLIIYNQFDIIPANTNQVFRAKKIPLNYPGILGNDLTSTGVIEDVNSLSENCVLNAGIEEIALNNLVIENPIVGGEIHFIDPTLDIKNLKLFDMAGKFIQSWVKNSQTMLILPIIDKGLYIFRFDLNGQTVQQRVLIQ